MVAFVSDRVIVGRDFRVVSDDSLLEALAVGGFIMGINEMVVGKGVGELLRVDRWCIAKKERREGLKCEMPKEREFEDKVVHGGGKG